MKDGVTQHALDKRVSQKTALIDVISKEANNNSKNIINMGLFNQDNVPSCVRKSIDVGGMNVQEKIELLEKGNNIDEDDAEFKEKQERKMMAKKSIFGGNQFADNALDVDMLKKLQNNYYNTKTGKTSGFGSNQTEPKGDDDKTESEEEDNEQDIEEEESSGEEGNFENNG